MIYGINFAEIEEALAEAEAEAKKLEKLQKKLARKRASKKATQKRKLARANKHFRRHNFWVVSKYTQQIEMFEKLGLKNQRRR